MKAATAAVPARRHAGVGQLGVVASVRSASASNKSYASASTESAVSSASRSRRFRSTTFGQGVSSPAFDSPWIPRSSGTGSMPRFAAQNQSPGRCIGGDQVEAVVAGVPRRASRTCQDRSDRRAASRGTMRAARRRIGVVLRRGAHVGQHRDPAGGRQAQPGAAGLKVAAAEHGWRVGVPATTRPSGAAGRAWYSSRLAATTSGKRACTPSASARRHMRRRLRRGARRRSGSAGAAASRAMSACSAELTPAGSTRASIAYTSIQVDRPPLASGRRSSRVRRPGVVARSAAWNRFASASAATASPSGTR